MSDWWSYPTDFNNTITNTANDSVTGVGSFFGTYPASIIGDNYGLGIISIVWLITFILSNASGVRKAMAASSFITFLLGTYLWRIGIAPLWTLFALIVLMILGVIGGKDDQL